MLKTLRVLFSKGVERINRSSNSIEDLNRQITKGFDVTIQQEQNSSSLTWHDECLSKVYLHRLQNGITSDMQIKRSRVRTRKFCKTILPA